MVGIGLLWEKITAGWLVAGADLVWKKNTVDWLEKQPAEQSAGSHILASLVSTVPKDKATSNN